MGKPHDQHHASTLGSKGNSMAQTSMTLKVLIHCEGCRRKVKKIIKCVEGVESVNIEAQSGKVTVSGKGVDARDVLQSLQEAGKFAEIWQLGGGKLPPMNQPQNLMNSGINKPMNNFNNSLKDSNNNGNMMSMGNNMKAVGWEKPNAENSKGFTPKGKPNEGMNVHGFGNSNMNGCKMDLPNLGARKAPFPNQFEKPSFPTENIAIMSKNVAPMPAMYRGEASGGQYLERTEYTSADYATHLFSDENANNCSIM